MAAEVLVRVNNPAAPEPQVPELYRMLRLDLLQMVDGKPQPGQVEFGQVAAFAPVALIAAGGAAVTVSPARWDDCLVRFSHASPPWPQIEAWLARWLDREEQRPKDADGLSGVVHSMSEPRTQGSRHYLFVDFGSAGPEALVELLELLAGSGATRVGVSSETGDG